MTADKATRVVHPSDRLLDITAVARWLGVNTRHVRRLVAERRIPYVKWGHLLRFDPVLIDEWVIAHTISVNSSAGDAP